MAYIDDLLNPQKPISEQDQLEREKLYFQSPDLSAAPSEAPAPEFEEQPTPMSQSVAPVQPEISPEPISPLVKRSDLLSQFQATRQKQMDELKSAQDARDSQLRNLALLQGANTIASGFSVGRGGKGETADLTNLQKMAQLPVEKLAEKQSYGKQLGESEMEEYKLGSARQLADPNSPVSKAYRDLLSKRMKIQVPENASALELKDLVEHAKGLQGMSDYQNLALQLQKERLGFMQDQEGRRAKQFEWKVGENDKQRGEKIIGVYNKDDVVKQANKSLAQVDKANGIIEKGGKLSASVMGRVLARMSGEVGVMTDADVEAFRGSPAWTDAMERWLVKGTTGELTETDKKEMQRMVNLAKNVEIQNLKNRADVVAGQYADANPDVPKEQIRHMLNPAISVYEARDKVRVQLPNGKIVNGPRENLREFLKRNPEAKVLH